MKSILTTLLITTSLSVNAKWVDLICEPQLFGGYWHRFGAEPPKKKCTTDIIDKRFSSDSSFRDCYTWMIGFDSDGDSAEVESIVAIPMTYKLKKSSSHYNLMNNDAVTGAEFTIRVNRETLKYQWKLSDKFEVRSNIGQCRLSSRKNII
jgi:hypothetical protein